MTVVATKVLVVEDEPAIADAVVSRLKSEGFDATAEGDGLRAVELCRELKPDLVVLDLMLPGINGLEVCRRIQADRRVPVVMLRSCSGGRRGASRTRNCSSATITSTFPRRRRTLR